MNTQNTAPCSDADACTQGDLCAEGACTAGAQLQCDDQNPCTDDSCADGACVFTPNESDCDDGNACTDESTCVGGACQGQSSVECDDGDLCTDDSCHPVDGCVAVPNIAPCTDLNACTVNDVCLNGTCESGADLVCDDGDDCTTDSCDEAVGCEHAAITPCCGNGVTEGDESCDDGNQNENDDCFNDCTAPLVADWRIGTWNGVPVMGIKNCASGDYHCQAEDACEQATDADCIWQSYNCSGYPQENGSFYPTSDGNGKAVSTSGSSSLNWTVTSGCSTGGSCEHGAGGVYGNLCCCDCPNQNQRWNEGNNYCGVGIWEPY